MHIILRVKLMLINTVINNKINSLPFNQSSELLFKNDKATLSSNIISFGELNRYGEITIDPDKTIKELINEAKFLGVKVNYGNETHLGKLINETLKDVKKAGYKMPKRIEYGGCEFTNNSQSLYYSYGTIYLNPYYNWANIDKESKINYQNGITSSDNPKHNIYHEIGHVLHRKNGLFNFTKLKTDIYNFSLEEKQLIFQNVGAYATSNPHEFVAEVFAGKMDGKKYNDEINKLYNKFKGPKPEIQG